MANSTPPTAYGIKVTGPAKVAGWHLSEAPNDGDLTAEDLAEIDAEFADKEGEA